MRTKPLLVASITLAALMAVAAGCSSSGDTATTTSSVVAKSSGDGGSSGGGSSGGGGSSDDDGGADTESLALPDGWPDELAMPDDVVVIESLDISEHSWKVVGRVDGDPEATLDAVEAGLTDADWNLEASNFEDSPQGGFGGVSGQNRQMTVAITLGPDPTGDTTELTILLAEKTSE